MKKKIMYKVAVPLMLDELNDFGTKQYIDVLKKTDASRILIAIDVLSDDEEARQKTLSDLTEKVKDFKREGYDVGVWMWTFLRQIPHGYVTRHFFNGRVAGREVCPLDEDFLADEEKWIHQCAASGVDIIQFDDDFNVSMGDLAGFGCCCEKHMKKYCEILGEDVSKEEFIDKIFKGGDNKYRDAWLQGNRETLLAFAKRMRKVVDSVNSSIRMGHCSVMSTYDIDGVDSFELARAFAGNTKPFVRLIGAPYWGEVRQFTCRPADLFTLERMEASWCQDDEIEILTEGDVFPRPRYAVPAAHLEMFDLALRCENRTDGILRYMIDYNSSVNYEKGYVERYLRNATLYHAVDTYFRGKEDSGVRVYEALNKIRDIELPSDTYVGDTYINSLFYSPAAHLLNYSSLASTFYGKGNAGIAFGENVKLLGEEELNSGLILDIPAALKLKARGIDVGLLHAEKKQPSAKEYFAETGELCGRWGASGEYAIQVADRAIVTSYYGGIYDRAYPACYRYENGEGQRFVVFAFDGYCANEVQFRCYERQRQLVSDINWLTGRKPDAVCLGNPDLYIVTKKSEKELSVGLFNMFIDSMLDPVVELAEEAEEVEFINCAGSFTGDRILLSDIPPYSFAALRITLK